MRQEKYFCDKCKKEVESVFLLSRFKYRIDGWLRDKHYYWDLCKDCGNDLVTFMEGQRAI